jgi:hypothetical protein
MPAILSRSSLTVRTVSPMVRTRSHGMKCVAVRCVGHHPEVALRQAGTDLIVETLEQVSAQKIQELLSK